MTAIERLVLTYAGSELCAHPLVPDLVNIQRGGNWQPLMAMLYAKNGFFAYEGALHVFPLGESCEGVDLVEWNRPALWKDAYARIDLGKITCFAQNIFGDQFCLTPKGVERLDPETGEMEYIANELEQWAKALLGDPNYHLGYTFARAWQSEHGPLAKDVRLVPKVPFVCGGEFQIANLVPMEAVKGMRLRGELATQLYDVPDGSTVRFILDKE